MAVTARLSSLERTGFVLVAACLGVVQLRLLVAQVLFGLAALLWLYIVVREGRVWTLPRFFVPLVDLRGFDPGERRRVRQPGREFHRFQATAALPDGPDRDALCDGAARRESHRCRDRDGRGRCPGWDRPGRDLRLRRARQAAGRAAQPLHDLFGRADAGRVRSGGAIAVLPEGVGLAGDRRPGTAGRARDDAGAQCVDRHLCGAVRAC